jgi:hypothetical protein
MGGCPFPELIKSIRDWTNRHAASDQEIAATVYAYAMRQLKYPDTDKELARTLICASIERLGALQS